MRFVSKDIKANILNRMKQADKKQEQKKGY